jgi:hypothetical protein
VPCLSPCGLRTQAQHLHITGAVRRHLLVPATAARKRHLRRRNSPFIRRSSSRTFLRSRFISRNCRARSLDSEQGSGV